jgi:hypothetical protein
MLQKIPFDNGETSQRKTIGFDARDSTDGDGTVPYEIAINATTVTTRSLVLWRESAMSIF